MSELYIRLVRPVTLGVVTWIWLASGVAVAGDLYLRGGLGFDQPDNTEFTDTDCASTVPAALYGCGTGGDGTHYRSVGDFDKVLALELGLGYATGAARIEVQLEYHPRFEFEGRANFLASNREQSVSANLSSVSGMLAGYVDFDGLVLPTSAPLVPFFGAGIGAVRTRIGKTTIDLPATTTIVRATAGLTGLDGKRPGSRMTPEEGVSSDRLAPIRSWQDSHTTGFGFGSLARREPAAAVAQSRSHKGGAQGTRYPTVAALHLIEDSANQITGRKPLVEYVIRSCLGSSCL